MKGKQVLAVEIRWRYFQPMVRTGVDRRGKSVLADVFKTMNLNAGFLVVRLCVRDESATFLSFFCGTVWFLYKDDCDFEHREGSWCRSR